MSIATLIRRMSEAGAPPEAIALAVEEIEALQGCLDARRTADRDRKRVQRERQKSENVTGQSDDSHGTVTDEPSPLSPPLKSTPDPEKITPPLTPQPADCRVRVTFPPPEGVEADQWKAFRQQRKKSLTDRAYLMICNKLATLAEAGWPPGEMIDLAIERGWETVFEPKDQGNGQANRGNQRSMGGPRPDPTLALVRAATDAQREDRGNHGQARFALPAS